MNELTANDVAELQAMFKTPGYAVLRDKIWTNSKEYACDSGMDESVPEEQRAAHRGVWACRRDDLNLEQTISMGNFQMNNQKEDDPEKDFKQ